MKIKYQVWNDETNEFLAEFKTYKAARKYLERFGVKGFNFTPYHIHYSL